MFLITFQWSTINAITWETLYRFIFFHQSSISKEINSYGMWPWYATIIEPTLFWNQCKRMAFRSAWQTVKSGTILTQANCIPTRRDNTRWGSRSPPSNTARIDKTLSSASHTVRRYCRVSARTIYRVLQIMYGSKRLRVIGCHWCLQDCRIHENSTQRSCHIPNRGKSPCQRSIGFPTWIVFS